MTTNKREKLLHKNAALWSDVDPKHAVLLPYLDCDGLTFCSTKNGEENLKREEQGEVHFWHSQDGALAEAEEWFQGLDAENSDVLYVYGVGLGYFYEAAKAWLKKKRKRHLVFLEDDLAVIYRLFETERATSMLRNSRVHLRYFPSIKELSSILEILSWHFLLASHRFSALPSYAATRSRHSMEIHHQIEHSVVMKNSAVHEYLHYGASFFRNYYANLRLLDQSYLGNSFFGNFKNVPAIICGAGPSLEKNVGLMGDLLDRALIFAGGSAMNALNSKGIIPHFGAGIDPNAPQFDRLSSNTAFEVPYFYRNRMHWKAFRTIHGPRLYVTGAGGYEISEWFDERFGWEDAEIDEGHNVVNFCVEIAQRMGCNPIVFAGVDLAYTDMQAYAEGVIEQRDVSKQSLYAADEFDALPLERPDINGKPTYTLWKWIAESEWISDYTKEHPETTFINATEGGLGFPDVQNMPLKTVSKHFFTKTYDLHNRIHGETQNSVCPQVTSEKVKASMQELAESLTRCLDNIEILIHENEVLQKKIKEKESVSTLQTGRAVLAETELLEEPGYEHLLDMFNILSGMVLNYEYRKLKNSRASKEKKDLRMLKLNLKKLCFVRDATRYNLALLKDSLEEESIYARD